MILNKNQIEKEIGSITRTCGGDPKIYKQCGEFLEYYPHMRGWSWIAIESFEQSYVLPAHAGVILSKAFNNFC